MFQLSRLSVLSYANGFTLWHYKANDTAASAFESRFFADGRDMLNVGDMVIVSAPDGTGAIGVVSDCEAPSVVRIAGTGGAP